MIVFKAKVASRQNKVFNKLNYRKLVYPVCGAPSI